MHKKGFLDMVKWLLAWFIRVFKSSGPSPSISSTNVWNNHSKQHDKAENKSALKILIWFLYDISGYMKNNESGFIGIGSVDISEHFNMMESRDLWICKKCKEILFWKMSKGKQRMILEASRSWFHWIWSSNDFPMNFQKLSNMKKWLIILCGTETLKKNVQKLSYEHISI